jgi:GntR family carbon starvation induced transcriptional regulator
MKVRPRPPAPLNTDATSMREALSLLTLHMLMKRMDKRSICTTPANRENFIEILRLRCVAPDIALRQSIDQARCWRMTA